MVKKKLVSSIILFFIIFQTKKAFPNENSHWEIEVDPIAIGLNGYSAHIGRTSDILKIDLGTASENLTASQTKTLLNNKNFKTSFVSYGIKCIFKEEKSGWN